MQQLLHNTARMRQLAHLLADLLEATGVQM